MLRHGPKTCFMLLLFCSLLCMLWLLNIEKRESTLPELVNWACWKERWSLPGQTQTQQRRFWVWACSHAFPSPPARSAAPPHWHHGVSSRPLSPAPALAGSGLHSGPHSSRPWSTLNHSHLSPCGLQKPTTSGPLNLSCQFHTRLSHLLCTQPVLRFPSPCSSSYPLDLYPQSAQTQAFCSQAVPFHCSWGHVSITSGLLFSHLSISASILETRRPEGLSSSTSPA